MSFLYALAWALLHSVWQGGIVALTAGAWLRHTRSPRERYAGSVLGLTAMVMVVAATLAWLLQPKWMEASPLLHVLPNARATASNASGGGSLVEFLAAYLSAALGWERWVAGGWLTIVAGLFVRQLVGLMHSRWLRRAVPVRADYQRLAEIAAARMGIRRRVRIVAAAEIDSPLVVGVLRPTIVVPFSSFEYLNETQALGILAHELAHVRRNDYVTNLLQIGVVNLFFFHPAVRWLARVAREERERICDEAGAEVCGDRIVYARALFSLEEKRSPLGNKLLAVGANSAPLLQRIASVTAPPVRVRHGASLARAVFSAAICVAMLGACARTLLPPTAHALSSATSLAPMFYTVNATDPAGVFSLTVNRGRAISATIDGRAVPPQQIVQRADSVYLRDANARTVLSLAMKQDGGFTWQARTP